MKVTTKGFPFQRYGWAVVVLLVLGNACSKNPKVIQANEPASSASSGIFEESPSPNPQTPANSASNASFSGQVHKVVVQEILPTSKYVYLKVTEGVEQFWIATRKQDVQLGGRYFYRDGLLKTNFESKEYNRVFERIYLVSKLVPEQHGGNNLPSAPKNYVEKQPGSATPASSSASSGSSAGSISIADLLRDPSQYEGKEVQISGTCTKINPNIMNRNWIHVKDGTRDDFDLVITTTAHVHEGEAVKMRARVTLNKDFGAGYRYDLILEDGVVLK